MTLSDAKKRKLSNKYAPANLFLKTYNYDVWFENEKLTDTRKSEKLADTTGGKESTDLRSVLPLEGDEEVKEWKGLKRLTSNKLLTMFPILLAQIKGGNNSNKFKKSNQTNTISFA